MKIPFDEVKDYLTLGWIYLGPDHENPRMTIIEKSPTIKIDFERILYKFPVVWENWETDSYAWVVLTKDNSLKILTTNHGVVQEESINFLNDRINFYQNLLSATHKAIKILQDYS